MELDIGDITKSSRHSLNDAKFIDPGHSINLYKTPPYGQLTLEECEDLFRQRLDAYAILEKADMSEKNIPVLANSFREIKSYAYKSNCILLRTNDKQQQRLDSFSHMLARMYCVYQPSLWPWFKTCERRLFNYRLRDQAMSLSGGQLESILKSYKFDFERVIGSDLSQLIRENLIGWNRNEKGDIFKVKFVDALKFVAKRMVSLKDGYAYLTKYEIISVVCDVFENHLETELQYARQHLNTDLPQTRQLIESMELVYRDFEERRNEERKNVRRNQDDDNRFPYRIDIEDLDRVVDQHYPPCMRHLQEALSQDHHLKHQARVHYGAFLRSGGVDMESAIEFWRKEFTKKIPNDKFERDYKYNIRHLYGKEGHKKALSCFSCDKIINDNPPGPGEKHGCPFKQFGDSHLRNMLVKHGLKEVDIDSIMLIRNESKDYKLACTDYFKYRKGHRPAEMIRNPMQFYYESQRLANMPPELLEQRNEAISDNGDTEMQSVTDAGDKNSNAYVAETNIDDEQWDDDF